MSNERLERRPRASSDQRRLAVVATGLVVVLVAIGGWVITHRETTTATAAPRTIAVAHGTVTQSVSATGTLVPATESDLSFGSAGTVTTLDVAVGESVTAGQVLATIDPSALQSAVTLAQAGVTAAQTAYDAASSATSVSANAQLQSAQAKLTSAQLALSQATLTSPIAGTVAAVNVAVGAPTGSSGGAASSAAIAGAGNANAGAATSTSRVGGGAGGTNGGGATSTGSGSGSSTASSASSAAIAIIDTSKWTVLAQVTSANLATLKQGMQAQVIPNGSRTTVFGTVKSIGLIASSNSGGTTTFPVTISLTGAQSGLYSGTAAAVTITTAQIDDVLTVPTGAITTSGTSTVVQVVRGDATVSVPVTLGRLFGSTTEITAGLSDGDQVVVPSFGGRGGTGTSGRSGGTGGGLGGGLGGGGLGGSGGFGGSGSGTRNGG